MTAPPPTVREVSSCPKCRRRARPRLRIEIFLAPWGWRCQRCVDAEKRQACDRCEKPIGRRKLKTSVWGLLCSVCLRTYLSMQKKGKAPRRVQQFKKARPAGPHEPLGGTQTLVPSRGVIIKPNPRGY